MMGRFITLFAAVFSLAAPSEVVAEGHYVFVWTADEAKQGNDFLAVIDADPASAGYGKLVAGVGTDIKSVQAHHTEYEMPASGKLFANDHASNQSVIFDLNEPLKPKVSGRFASLGGFAMPHSYLRLPNGNVLATFQFPDHGDHGNHGDTRRACRDRR